MKWLVVSQSVDSMHVWHSKLRSRARLLLTRRRGFITMQRHSLVQHLNSACRAARQHPELAASRILMSLHDEDIVIRPDEIRERSPIFMLMAVYVGGLLAALPAPPQCCAALA